MPVNLETLEIQFKVNTAGATSSIRKLQAAAQKIRNVNMKVTADTKVADRKLQKTRRTLEEMEDTSVSVDADTSKAEIALGKLGKVMSALGLIHGAKKVFTIAVDLVNTSYASTSANNRLEMLLPENAQAEIRAYADEMNKLYGLNETGLISMSTNFASAFVGMGVEADKAARYAERLTAAAIDYASALDKTPAEVSETIMSLMRGNTAVADNIGLFGLTVDKLNKQAEQLKAEGLVPQNMAEGTEKYIALLHEIERNADTQGFTGDWARTFDEYGNQPTALAEQWQTLKENAGNLLQPAATQIAQALNSILLSVILWTENIGKEDSFSETVKGYFGDYEMTEQEITDLVNSITKPTNDMVAAMQQSRTDLGKAYLEYDKSLNTFVGLLNRLYVGGEEISKDEMESLFAAWDDVETLGIDGKGGVFDQLKNTLTTMFTTLSGEVSSEVANAGVTLIDSYFDAMQEEAMKKSIELTTSVNNALQDGILTSEEMQDINAKVAAVNKSVYEGYDLAVGAESARYVDTHNFQASSDSWLAFYNQATSASADARTALEAQYETLEKEMYKMAEYMALKYEEWGPEEYKQRTGLDRVYSGAELMQLSKENLAAELNQMDAKTLGAVARAGISQIVSGSMEAVKSGDMTNYEFAQKLIAPILSQSDFATRARELEGQGATLDKDTLDFLALYDYASNLVKGTGFDQRSVEAAGVLGDGALERSVIDLFGTDMATAFSSWLGGEAPSLLTAPPESRMEFEHAIVEDLSSSGDALDGAAENLNNAAAALSNAASKPVIVRVQYTDGSQYNQGRGTQNASDVFTAVNGP